MRVLASMIAVLLGTVPLASARASAGSARSGGYSLELIDETGSVLPTFQKGGRTYVLGALGQRYSLRIRNGSSQRVELVASVDGRDVLDGLPADWDKRGYIVEPYREIVIDGFRLNNASVAAFRFSSVNRSYASSMGDARDVGVVGVAVFAERQRMFLSSPPMNAPNDARRGDRDEMSAGESLGGLGAAQSAPAAPSAEARSAFAKKTERPGLGTEFGEQRESPVNETQFERGASKPALVLSLRYDDRAGLLAMGINLDRSSCDVRVRETAEPFRRDVSFAQPPPGWSGR